jgi:hypothetical protein
MKVRHGALALSILAASLGGCASPELGPGMKSYSASTGVLTAVEAVPLEGLVSAANVALENLRPVVQERDASSALIVAHTEDERAIHIRLRSLSASTTEVKMRMLFIQDRQRLEQIFEQMKEGL